MGWRKEYLDLVLAPLSLFIMFGYHLFLLYRYLKHPKSTVIGYENHNKRAWVDKMMEIDAKERPAISVLGNSISAAATLSSISLVLSSLIGAWLGSSNQTVFTSNLIYGDTSPSIISIKYISLLICFLVAFGAFVHGTRCFVHASYLMTMPINAGIPVGYIEKEVIRGNHFYEFGMRALYFSTTFLVWVFGPIPMFVSSLVMVILLHNLDTNSMPMLQFGPLGHQEFMRTNKITNLSSQE
ncbi:OLC1v1023152C2 [Oldenlandia corymbosa var. corymbosa]|nr:OLC1v1023152C2 [Oldenlandia corymbosa var. corymbosa]